VSCARRCASRLPESVINPKLSLLFSCQRFVLGPRLVTSPRASAKRAFPVPRAMSDAAHRRVASLNAHLSPGTGNSSVSHDSSFRSARGVPKAENRLVASNAASAQSTRYHPTRHSSLEPRLTLSVSSHPPTQPLETPLDGAPKIPRRHRGGKRVAHANHAREEGRVEGHAC
jgi:hypothetical protein